MVMMPSATRVKKLLRVHDFLLVDYHPGVRTVLFARNDPTPELYQRVRISCSGKLGEAAAAYADVSVVRGANATKGLVETKLLMELASDRERGWTILNSRENAVAWEKRFAEVAPREVAVLAREKGAELLAATATHRSAANDIRARLGDLHDLMATGSRLERQASRQQREHARRIAEWPGVLQIVGADMVYDIATTAIMLHASELKSLQLNVESDPLTDREFMWLIQILVDRIIIDSGWQPQPHN